MIPTSSSAKKSTKPSHQKTSSDSLENEIRNLEIKISEQEMAYENRPVACGATRVRRKINFAPIIDVPIYEGNASSNMEQAKPKPIRKYQEYKVDLKSTRGKTTT